MIQIAFFLLSLFISQSNLLRANMISPHRWQEIKPGGDTICARGDEFSFFVHPGDPKKVIVDFIGGGACWSDSTCAEGTATFTDSIDELKRRQENGLGGIYDKNNPQNIFQNWTHIVGSLLSELKDNSEEYNLDLDNV